MKYKPCPNCGKKGFFKGGILFIKGKTHKCKYCDMEFKVVINKGKKCWGGDIPMFK